MLSPTTWEPSCGRCRCLSFEAKDAPAPSPGTHRRRSVATYRRPARPIHSRRMRQLLPRRWLWRLILKML
jgi:hypothetical protein